MTIIRIGGTGMSKMRPEPIQLKPGTISGLVRPPVRISAAPETMLIMPSVTISGLSFSRVAKRPLIEPMNAPSATAAIAAIQMLMPTSPWRTASSTPTSPAIAATERSSPPAMMSGVPAAAISPMKATFEPIAIMLRSVRKNGESEREDDQQADVEDQQDRDARPGLAEQRDQPLPHGQGLLICRGVALAVIVIVSSLQAALKAGSAAVAAISSAGSAPFSKRPTMRPRSSTIERSLIPATSSTSEDSTSTARPRSASARSSR